MNALAKNLKLSCIACLFLGLAAIVVGIVAGIQGSFDADAIATLACGLGATPAGAQASRLANVPSNAKRVLMVGFGACAGAIILGAVAHLAGNPTPIQLGAVALIALASFAVVLFAQRQVKVNEQV